MVLVMVLVVMVYKAVTDCLPCAVQRWYNPYILYHYVDMPILTVLVVPKTADNFRALCTGEKGVGQQGKPLSFKGRSIHAL